MAQTESRERVFLRRLTLPFAGRVGFRADGKLWRTSAVVGGLVVVPMDHDEVMLGLRGKRETEEVKPLLQRVPDHELWRLPSEILAEWSRRLLSFDTEALVVYGKARNPQAEQQWLAVVPKQQNGGASVKVEDLPSANARLSSRGYRRVGTIHTHPGFGTGASGEDLKECFADGGIHMIVAGRNRVGTYYSAGSQCAWPLEAEAWARDDMPEMTPTELPCETMEGPQGESDWRDLVRRQTYTMGFGGWDRGRWHGHRRHETYTLSDKYSPWYGNSEPRDHIHTTDGDYYFTDDGAIVLGGSSKRKEWKLDHKTPIYDLYRDLRELAVTKRDKKMVAELREPIQRVVDSTVGLYRSLVAVMDRSEAQGYKAGMQMLRDDMWLMRGRTMELWDLLGGKRNTLVDAGLSKKNRGRGRKE